MSYDFRLCLPQAGRDPLEIALADAGEADGPVAAGVLERNRRLARALVSSDHGLSASGDSAEENPEAPVIELLDADSGDGTQISLFATEAAVSIPYWHKGAAARRVFERVWKGLEVLQREGGYFIYDAQAGGIVDLKADFDSTVGSYETCSRRSQAAIARQARRNTIARLFPPTLERRPYFYRWMASFGVALAAGWGVGLLTLRSALEPLLLFPFGGWLIFKVFVLDTARLRNLGWSPRVALVSIFPPAALLLQLPLFFAEGMAAPAKARSARPRREKPDAEWIFPYVVPAAYLEFQKEGTEAMTSPLGHGLHVVLVQDLERSVRGLLPEDLSALGLSAEEAVQKASENLARLVESGAIRRHTARGPRGHPFVQLGGHWAAASAILWPGLRTLGAGELGSGDLAASIPHRDALLLFPKGDPAFRREMEQVIRKREWGRAKPLTLRLFQITPEGPAELHDEFPGA